MMAEQGWYEEGRAAVINGNNIVTGVGTFWLTHVRPGDMFSVTDGGPAAVFYEVLSVEDDRQITLSKPYKGETKNDAEYAIIRNFTGRWSVSADLAVQMETLIRQFRSLLQNNPKAS